MRPGAGTILLRGRAVQNQRHFVPDSQGPPASVGTFVYVTRRCTGPRAYQGPPERESRSKEKG